MMMPLELATPDDAAALAEVSRRAFDSDVAVSDVFFQKTMSAGHSA